MYENVYHIQTFFIKEKQSTKNQIRKPNLRKFKNSREISLGSRNSWKNCAEKHAKGCGLV